MTEAPGAEPVSDIRYHDAWVRTASKEEILRRDLDNEIRGRKNLEAHCAKLEIQLAEKNKQASGGTDEVSQSLPQPADQKSDDIQTMADESSTDDATDASSPSNEIELENTRLKAANEDLKRQLSDAQEDAQAAKEQKVVADQKLTLEKGDMTKLRGLAQDYEPKLRPHLHGQPIINPGSNEEWALFGWLGQALDNVVEWYVGGAKKRSRFDKYSRPSKAMQ